jgi:hypothetical protein
MRRKKGRGKDEQLKNREETNRMNRKLNGPILVSRTGDVG